MGKNQARLVTHRGIEKEDIEKAVPVIAKSLSVFYIEGSCAITIFFAFLFPKLICK